MKKLLQRVLGGALAACVMLTSSTAFAARQGASAAEPVMITARATERVNLALNKTATANEVETGTQFRAQLAVDGSMNTRWASNPKKNVPGAKWLQVDFGEETTFDTVEIFWEQLNIIQYRLEVSNDPSAPENWTTVYESNSKITTKDESILLPKDAKGRYLRVYVTDCDGAESNWDSVSIYELAVYYEGNGEEPVGPVGNYLIYPTPQKVTDAEQTVLLSNTVNVIKEDGIDTVTKNRIDEVFAKHGLAVEYSAAPVQGKTNLYIGINGSGGLADTYEGIPRDVFAAGANKFDMHVVQIKENGDLVILGKDTDAAYYGLATLEQVLDQAEGSTLKVSTFEDYANQKYRGAVEGYYGYPWTVDGTLSWMDYAKRYKMNVFLYGPKSDPYHLGKWRQDYPTELTDDETAHGVLTQDDIRTITTKAAACNVDFVWVAHPAMQNGINFSSNATIDQGVEDLMVKFAHMYDLGVREFGVFLDDITGSASGTRHAYLIDQVQKKLYETYNIEGASAEDQIKPLFFTPTYYTTSGASSYLSAFKNVHEDVVVCFTGNDVFSDIRNSDAALYESWLGRSPCLWWNYPVNDNDDNVFYTCPVDSFYSLDSNLSNLVGVVSNPMNFEEASKVAFHAIADYAWNPAAFNAQRNWNHCFDSIIPDDADMAAALKVVYSSLNKKIEPADLRKLYNQFKAEVGTDETESAVALRDRMDEIINAIQKLETLKDSENPAYRLLVSEAQTSMNKLYDMAVVIKGVINATLSDDPVTVYQGYYSAQAAFDRLNIVENPRYEMVSLEGAGEEITINKLSAVCSDTYMRPFTEYIVELLDTVELPELDPSLVGIQSVSIVSGDAEVKQGESGQYVAQVIADQADAVEIIWSVEGNSDVTTIVTPNGLLTMGKNELSQEITVRATSAYDSSKSATYTVTVLDRVYEDPTVPANVAYQAVVIGATGDPTGVEVPERALDENNETKWCPGANTSINQWMAIDLGAKKTISKWTVLHAGSEGAAYITKDFSLQVLKDENPTPEQLKDQNYLGNNDNWTTIKRITNNGQNLTEITFDDPPAGRYFRLFVANGGSGGYPATRIYEWKMMGVDTHIMENTYNLSVDPAIANGSVLIESEHYQAGVRVNFQVIPEQGYQLKEGSLKYNGIAITGTRFIMPEEDVVITAEFEPISSEDSYKITVDQLANGAITVNKQSAKQGETVLVTVTPDAGYRLVEDSLKANGMAIEDHQFIMPAGDVVITAEFEEIPAPVYTITVEDAANGTVTVNKQSAKQGETVFVTVAPDAGYRLVEDSLKANGVAIEDHQFIMPAGDVVITAEFEEIPAPVYTITVEDAANGTVTVNKQSAKQGETVFVTVAPDAGYRLVEDSLKVNGVAIEDHQFVMPAGDVVITAEFEEIPSTVVTDVLKAVIVKAEQLLQDGALNNTMEAVIQEFHGALQAGKALADNPGDATQEDINAATIRLLNVMAKVDWKQGDKTVLQVAVDIARTIKENIDLYAQSGKQVFLDVLNTAEAILASGNAWEDDIQETTSALIEAMTNLRMLPNKDVLNQMIGQAKQMDLSLYTEPSVNALLQALRRAEIMAAKESVSQYDVDDAEQNLRAALAGMVRKNEMSSTSSGSGTITTGEGSKPTKTGDNGFAGIALLTLISASCALWLTRKKDR